MNKRYEPLGRLSKDKDVMKFPKMADECRPASLTALPKVIIILLGIIIHGLTPNTEFFYVIRRRSTSRIYE